MVVVQTHEASGMIQDFFFVGAGGLGDADDGAGFLGLGAQARSREREGGAVVALFKKQSIQSMSSVRELV